MSRHEQDREDLLREATALVERIEWRRAETELSIVVGFRRDGSASMYVGADPVFQFNAKGEFRRGYFRGRLVKASDGRLFAMHRERIREATQLVSEPMSPGESAELFASFHQQRDALATGLLRGEFTVVGQVPAEGDVASRVVAWLQSMAGEISIASRPNVA